MDLIEPFVTLGRGAFSRTLLGSVVGPGGDVVRTVAIKLQSDEYPLLSGEGGVTCRDVERGWEREAKLLERSAMPTGIVEVLQRVRGEAALLPPTLFCKRRRAFFTSVCPTCGGPLADARDDALLESRGLPRRDASLTRFLWCTACAAEGRFQVWTLVREGPMSTAVGDQSDLLRAYAPLARREGDALPCQGCEHVMGCYPDDPARAPEVLRTVVPLTFFEARAVATEPAPLRFDECVALIGGAPWAQIVDRIQEPSRAVVVRELAARVDKGARHLLDRKSVV